MEEAAGRARPVDVRRLILIALFVLAFIGAVVDFLRGRRPPLISPAYS
jgi:hypothetical protein